jgi:CRP-like cAMP-binding protein
VAKMLAGESFGDVALLNDSARAATILTLEPCEIIKVEKVI